MTGVIEGISKYWAQFYSIPYVETSAKLDINVDVAFLTAVNLLRQRKNEQIQEESKTHSNCCCIS